MWPRTAHDDCPRQERDDDGTLTIAKFLLAKRYLRAGDGLLHTPASRLKERVFGQGGGGRATLASAGMKLEVVGRDEIPPHEDTCIAAFVREIALAATQD